VTSESPIHLFVHELAAVQIIDLDGSQLECANAIYQQFDLEDRFVEPRRCRERNVESARQNGTAWNRPFE
jgi:hypothetical protein